MEINISSETDNRVLLRKEYEAVVTHTNEATPKRIDVKEKIAALTNSDPERTVVVNIVSEYGIGRSKLVARIYDTPEMMNKVELPYLLKRNGHITEEKK